MLVSKEVSTLENEMLEFKEALAEWKGMPGHPKRAVSPSGFVK